jgi:hypothetical protein
MHVIEKAVHWAFAAFVAIVAYFAAMALGAFLTLKLVGLQVGVHPPADFQPQIGTAGITLLAGILLFAPLALATFVGAMTAPFAQRGLAAVVFPVLVFAAMTWMTHAGHHGLAIATLLETAASCAVPGGLVFIRWQRQQSRTGEA